MFAAPIPGQSLTNEPKNSAWENPPQFADPVEALMFHMDKLQKPKETKAVVDILRLGLDVVTLTEGILRNGVATGRHTIDTSLLIAPVIHEYIKGIADATGIDYNEGLEDKEEVPQEDIEYSIRSREATKILADIKKKKQVDLAPLETAPTDNLEQMPMDTAPMATEEVPMAVDKPAGLMARGGR